MEAPRAKMLATARDAPLVSFDAVDDGEGVVAAEAEARVVTRTE